MLHPEEVAGDHPLHLLRLTEHGLGHPHPVGGIVPPPGKVASLFAKPAKKLCLHATLLILKRGQKLLLENNGKGSEIFLITPKAKNRQCAFCERMRISTFLKSTVYFLI
jgi:hypothetical protein